MYIDSKYLSTEYVEIKFKYNKRLFGLFKPKRIIEKIILICIPEYNTYLYHLKYSKWSIYYRKLIYNTNIGIYCENSNYHQSILPKIYFICG